ncbi:MAG: cupredoxin domain-containing protein [Candidatus Nitrosotenuis sp.]
MSNWDLMMPGMGLTAIGLAGVVISYAGIAHTFVDGMHALTGLTMFIGLIFLAAGILDGGVSTSNRAKATTLVVLGISLSFAAAAFNFTSISTLPVFAGVMLIVAVPAIVIAYAAMKMPEYTKPISVIFIIAVGAAITAYAGFGLYGPAPYLIPQATVEEIPKEVEPTGPVFEISVLADSSIQGNPDYEPDMAQVPLGSTIVWTNNDTVGHTVTSSADAGATFDSGLFNAGETFKLDTSKLAAGTYEYFCIVHPWMKASFTLEEPQKAPEFSISILKGSAVQGNPDYEPDMAQVPLGSTIVWTNNDTEMHTVTSKMGESYSFDSGIMMGGDTYRLDTTTMNTGRYEYLCIVHPWMTASFELIEDILPETPSPIVVEPVPEVPIEEPPVGETVVEEAIEPVPEVPATPTDTNTVSIPMGTGVPGCETDNACFIPHTLTVKVGTTVTWTNNDTAAHTVTSGDLKTGPLGKFDSGLFMAGKSFSFEFDTKGTYPYYCQVHPWMLGKVIVE